MNDIEIQLRHLELQLLNPVIRQNREAVSHLLADEFCEFGSLGHIFDKLQILDALESEPAHAISMSDFQTRIVTSGIALVTYRAHRHDSDAGSFSSSLRSSIWIMRGGRWQMIFHQGTKCSSLHEGFD